MANPDLPQEILLEIFSRFPAKSVGKCRTLSKYWNTHLSTKTFITKHLITRQQTIQQENIALTTIGGEVCIITSPSTKDEVLRNNRGFRNEEDKWSFVIGSCNGLILLKERENLLLVNPITLKQVTIQPHPHIIEEEFGDLRLDYVNFGFGYDSVADDYKVVKMTTIGNLLYKSTFVDLYSVKTRVWKEFDGCFPYHGFVPSRYAVDGGVFVNGAVHWLICERRGSRNCIAVFDLANEVFHEIDLPYGFVRQTGNEVLRVHGIKGYLMGKICNVSVAGGCLVIVDNFLSGDTDIWIMKKYGVVESWVRFRIEAEDNNWRSIVSPLCYVEGDELLCVTSRDYLLACNLEKGTVRKLVLGGCVGRFAHGTAFVDSLVSPDGSL